MSKPIILVMLLVTGAIAVTAPVFAAELLPPAGVRVHHQRVGPGCGPCGCLRVTYIYHRDIRTTYGTGFDPRNFDQTEPYFYPGPVRAYPRYWVCFDPAH
jgi:hypothetical protein